MAIEIKTGNLLDEKTDAIVNTVNCVGIMGKGIALQFKQRWPENYKAYVTACKKGQVHVGEMFVFELGELAPKPHYIINFPTKNHWRGNSKYEYIDKGLEDLVRVIKKYRISSIAIPPLGCGNGGLDWDTVRKKIVSAMEQIPGALNVHLYDPGRAPKAKAIVSRTSKPNLTPTRALLLKLLSIYKQLDYGLTMIEVQKLAYFGTISGCISGLQFHQNKYGPYTQTLNHMLDDLEGHYIQGVGDHDKIKSEITLLPNALAEADGVIADDPIILNAVDRIASLIGGFETPYGMELLSTVHWVANNPPYAQDLRHAIEAVYNWSSNKTWNSRKRSIMKEHHIEVAWNRLIGQNWIGRARASHI